MILLLSTKNCEEKIARKLSYLKNDRILMKYTNFPTFGNKTFFGEYEFKVIGSLINYLRSVSYVSVRVMCIDIGSPKAIIQTYKINILSKMKKGK